MEVPFGHLEDSVEICGLRFFGGFRGREFYWVVFVTSKRFRDTNKDIRNTGRAS
jgi:hypothetical protein